MRAIEISMCAVLIACSGDRAASPAAESDEEATHLNVPSSLIARARRESQGLLRMPETVRAHALEQGRAQGSPSYADLRAHADELLEHRASYAGRVGLVRPAGRGLWIVALMTRAEGTAWRDPIYVLSVVDPKRFEGDRARIDGWVCGERTIGRHALPLVVAFHVESVEEAGD